MFSVANPVPAEKHSKAINTKNISHPTVTSTMRTTCEREWSQNGPTMAHFSFGQGGHQLTKLSTIRVRQKMSKP